MARLGKLDEYDEKEQNFESYLERFEHFVTANDIKEEKKLAVFLSVIGPRTYEVLKSLVVPAVPGDKSFEEVTVLLTKHYSPSCSVIAEPCKFNKRAQEEQESVEDFIVALKHLARKCDFGLFMQDALRDRLVAGIRREETQLALFAEDSLTFEKACKIALDREQAARQTALLHAEGKEATLHAMAIRVQGTEKKLKLRKFKDVKRICERCGKAHAASVCWYKNVQCHSCSQIGHLQKMCPSKCRELKTANVVDCSDSDSEFDVYHVINTVRSGYEVQVNVEGKDICMQIDTGAAVTLIPESVKLNAFPHVKCEPSRVILRTYTGEPIPVKGQCNVIVTTGKQSLRLPVIIVKDHGKQLPLLMGRNWLEMLGLDWKNFTRSMREQQQRMKETHDVSRGVPRCFSVGDAVWVKTVRGESVSWDDGVVTQVVSPVTYLVKVSQAVRFTHVDHIRARYASSGSSSFPPVQTAPTASEDTAHPSAPMSSGPVAVPPLGVSGAKESANQQLPVPESPTPGTAAPGSSNQPDPAPTAELPLLRRSARVRHPPNRYQPSDFRS
ncbi:uncharacterized protein LOC119458790 [Dermacentor silvarum]|uniref:uncharacterized protein LOC119458790 n=1 Tax=Dermacentor silvarum TaxID=543639 RepID=UPI0021013DE4|nr:uncharacterized protein LOC119458790 [Dermacentor silvarum]